MARPFLASVPLALVLIASLIVPVALTPGTFGFHSWPTAAPERVVHDALPGTPGPSAVASGPGRQQPQRGTGKPARDAGRLAAVRTGHQRTAAPGGSTGGGSRSAPPTTSPGSTAPGPATSGPGAGAPGARPGETPAAPAPELPAPATPAADTTDDAPAPPVEVAQGDDLPVLREDAPEPESEPPAEDDESHWWHPGRALGHHPDRDCGEDDQESPTEGS